MIVGITARADWRGPKALKGRTMRTGRPNERWKLTPSASAAIFEALYGDCAWRGCCSSIGTFSADPYTSLVEVRTIDPTEPSSFAARSTFAVPITLVSITSCGCS